MEWVDTLIRKCNIVIQTGGEVNIQFSHRRKDGRIYCVPIIRSYPSNQNICQEVEIELDD